MHQQLLAAFFTYFSLLLAIGLIAHRKQKSSSDFIIGDRSLNYWVTAFSAHASDMSSWLFMAFPATVFTLGLPGAWIAFGLLMGMFFNWQFLARGLRVETEKYGSYTLPTFLERRFGDTSGTLRVITALLTLFFMASYLAAGMMAMGCLLEALFGINYYLGLTIAMVVATTYTFVGGYYTVAKVDQFQALFLIVMIVLVPFLLYFKLPDGFASIAAAAEGRSIPLTPLPNSSPLAFVSALFLSIGWGLGYFGQPHVVTKFMGIRDPDELRKSKYVGMTWQSISMIAATVIGLIGIGLFDGYLINPELVYMRMVEVLFPPFVMGFILCSVIAANMSTMDSQILVCASVASEDFYKRFIHKEASDQQLLIASRVSLLMIAFLSLGLAFMKSSSILDAVSYAWAGLGSSFGPVLLMALYSKRTNKQGAIAGIMTGGTVTAIWPSLNSYLIGTSIPAMIPGFFLSLVAIATFSKKR